MKLKCAVFMLAYFCHAVQSATILAVFSSLSFADHMVYRAYVTLLAQKNHTIVVMTPYPRHISLPEAEYIAELDVGEASAPFWDEYRKLMTTTDDYYQRLQALNEFSVRLAIAQLKSKQMMSLLVNPTIRFNLVITEADVPILYAFAEKYKVPHIAITASTGKIHQHEAKGDPVQPVMYPDVNALTHQNPTNWEKIVEVYRLLQTKNEYYNNYLPLCEVTARKLLGLKRPLKEVEYDIDLLFIASSPGLIGNRPTVPAVRFVDGMQIRAGVSLIPQGLLSILDSATKGAVYFSLGALHESEQLPTRLLQTLAEAFRELPFTVLWKIGNTTMINKPENVIAQAWFPQQHVLAHPNVKAFITHGGQRSLEEAVFYEVPIVGFPIVKSRKVFIGEVTKNGAGEIVDPNNLDKEHFKAVINAVMNNEKYKLATTKLKQNVFNPLRSGPDEAVWWTEYLLRHGTARHLRTTTVGVYSYKYFMLDVAFYLLVGICLVLYILFVTLRFIIRCVRRRFFARPPVVAAPNTKFKAL